MSPAAVTLHLRAPSYASVARLEVYVNGRVQKLLLDDGSVRIDGAGEISLPLVDPPAPRPSARLDAPLFGLPSDRDLAVVVLARVKVAPAKQWTVSRQFHVRLKRAFDRNGIEIPFPQRTINYAQPARHESGAAAEAAAG